MHFTITQLDKIYKKISKRGQNGNKILIFTALDVDSLCALLILEALMKNDNMHYQLCPVSGFSELDKKLIENSNGNFQVVIMINCGAIIDLQENSWVKDEKYPNLRVIIFDNHLPVNHNNINSEKKVWVFCDSDSSNIQQCPNPEEIQFINEDDEEEDNDINSQKSEKAQENEFEAIEAAENSQQQQEIGKKRKPQQQFIDKQQKKIKKQEAQEKLQNYYSGYFYSISSAFVMYKMYKMCAQADPNTINLKNQQNYLWYAIVGTTDLLIQHKNDKEIYERVQTSLNQEVKKLEKENEQGQINVEQDYKLMFMRNWNLIDSMRYSNYWGVKLETWKNSGKEEKKLLDLISRLGIPLEQVKQKYKFMDNQFQQKFENNIGDIAKSFKLYDIMFESFVRFVDSNLSISATDLVYSLNALLESPKQILVEKQILDKSDAFLQIVENYLQDIGENNNNKSINNIQGEEQKIAVIQEQKVQNFLLTKQILQSKDFLNNVVVAIEIAKEFQQALVNEAIFLIDRKGIELCQNFWWGLIKKEQIQYKKYFQHPYSIQKLAFYLLEIYKEKKKHRQDLPIVIAVENEIRDTYVIVGVVSQSNILLEKKKNDFGNKFIKIAIDKHFPFYSDDFETFVIEIQKENIYSFIEELAEL